MKVMKIVLLAGGFGTRISEESYLKPKPMIEIGGKPILWHIMKIYSYYGFNDFIICAGYKQNIIKEWFSNYFLYACDVTFDFSDQGKMIVHRQSSEPWKVTIVDTGLKTMTGGRIKRIREFIGNESFFLTYGDGLADVNICKLLTFHKAHGKVATITAIRPEGRFGVIDTVIDNRIVAFRQKIRDDSGWINGGFMVLEPKMIDYIAGDETVLEKEPFEGILRDGQMMCKKHDGFWQCMDTLRDREKLEEMWNSGHAPWKIWNDDK